MTAGQGKFKDDTPLNTVTKIRSILHGLGLLMIENWNNSVEGIYSLRIEVAGTPVGQNGKGTSPEFALASAYGEFMERLQNRLSYSETDLDPAAVGAGGFYLAPDEKYLTIDDVLAEESSLYNIMLPERPPGSGAEELLAGKLQQWFGETPLPDGRRELARLWATGVPAGCPGDFVALPFYSVEEDCLRHIPYQMLRLVYGSNGTCAGNTPEEALVQGMSELLERYAHKKVLFEKISPPSVPEKFLQGYPSLYRLLLQIIRGGKYRVVVKDCSLGLGLPVLAVAVIDNASQSYFVKFGAHPSFEIALERCLTEILQGRDLNRGLSGMMTQFDYCDRLADRPENTNTVLRVGAGSYPAEFFAGGCNDDYRGFPGVSGQTNRDLLHYLRRIITGLGYEILVRDVSYLGFPSFQVVSPGLSEVFDTSEKRPGVERLRQEARVAVRDLPGASPGELHKIASYLIRRSGYVFEGDNPGRLPGFPVKQSFPLSAVPNLIFLSQLLYRSGKVKEAHGMMRQYVASRQGDASCYHRCVRDLLGGMEKGVGREDLVTALKAVYPADTVDSVLAAWGRPEDELREYPVLPCFNCWVCPVRENCCQEEIKQLHIRLKEIQRQNPIDQMWLAELFRQRAAKEVG